MMKQIGCPICKCDVYFGSDKGGWFEQCEKCGYIRYLKIMATAQSPKTGSKEEGRHVNRQSSVYTAVTDTVELGACLTDAPVMYN